MHFRKSSLFKMFSVHTKTKKLAFSNSFGLKSVFEKPSFRYRLEWTVSPSRRNKATFSKYSKRGQKLSKDSRCWKTPSFCVYSRMCVLI